MIDLKQFEVWFVTGSQHLYGPETLEQVARHSQEIAATLNNVAMIPVKVVYKDVLTGPDEIRQLCLAANAAPNCIGLVAWMHTFSPAKMWIAGLSLLQKPLAHLHTQYNQEIPWSDIDMDFMNLNQSAHGDREFGFINSRLRINRKVIVGHWQDPEVHGEIGAWSRAAAGWREMQGMKVARFGDNMREVAVTEGDKVEAQLRFGYSVNGYGVGDLVAVVNATSDAEVNRLIEQYGDIYDIAPELQKNGARYQALRDAARIEIGLRHFLEAGNFKAFTTTFEDLHGLAQLPGIGPQRLMAEGYGFAGEGDWKTSALVHTMKVMASGMEGGTSFMEDYTYHLTGEGSKVLGSHMLEICETIAATKPRVEIHPLSIGGKADPVRLVFDARTGPAVAASVVDMGNRFRMIINKVGAVEMDQPLPRLPVARVLWLPEPNLKTAATAWILAGGAHHTSYSQALTVEHMEDFAEMAGIEFLVIDEDTTIREFKKELHWNEMYYGLAKGF